jgi:multidrug efflux pump subunit AcrA (membrane-fusion protein)
MLEVVASGLPAVRRLDELFNEAEVEPHQRVRDRAAPEEEAQELEVASSAAVVATALPTAALMAPGSAPPAVAGAPSTEATRLNRRRIGVLAAAAVVAILILTFAVTSLFSGPVEASGQLQPAEVAELNFVTTNEVTSLAAQPGQQVRAGQMLARQDSSALSSKLAADQAKLVADQLLLSSGPTPTETPGQLASETSQAESGLAVAQTKAANTSTLDGQAVDNASSQLTATQTTLANDQQAVTSACSNSSTQTSGETCSSAQHQVAIDQAGVSAAQGALRLAQQQQNTDGSNAQSQVAQAQAAVSTARANQSAGTQGQTKSQIGAEHAAVNADQAAVTADQKAVAQAHLVAPFGGTIAEVNGATGDLAGPSGVQQNSQQGGVATPSSGITLFPSAPVSQVDSRQPQQTSLITLESTAMNVIAQVGEGDIDRIHVRQQARVTFPADPSHVYTATVRTIDPESVNQGGKAYFLVNLGLVTSKHHAVPQPGGIRGLSGLTADVTFN